MLDSYLNSIEKNEGENNTKKDPLRGVARNLTDAGNIISPNKGVFLLIVSFRIVSYLF